MTTVELSEEYFASCPKGIEQLLSDELSSIGCQVVKQSAAGVSFKAQLKTLYKTLLWTRLANRIFKPLERAKAHDAKSLYSAVYQIPWEKYFTSEHGFVVDFIGQNQEITNTQFGAQRVKDAIVDRFVKLGLERPNVNRVNPDVRVNVRLTKAITIISLDLSGDSLHRRGYRLKQGKAPLKENLAAAVLMRAGWPKLVARSLETKERIGLLDPMCGSGTFLIEAAMMAANIAPGIEREVFACEKLLTHDEALWQAEKLSARQAKLDWEEGLFPYFEGRDLDHRMLQIAQDNVEHTSFVHDILLNESSLADFSPISDETVKTGLLICNPPYGERLGEIEALREDYQTFGQVVKQHLAGWQVGIFTGNVELASEMRLRAKNKYKFFNGKIPAELHVFDIVERSQATLREDRDIRTMPLSEGAQMVFNRLQKNQRKLAPWLKKNDIQCYRLYDADMPEYAAAIDVYDEQYHIQEYQAPKSVDAKKAQMRFNEIVQACIQAFDLEPEQVVSKTRRRQKGSEQYTKSDGAHYSHYFQVEEYGANLWVNLEDYLDTGLFLDHRPLRQRLYREASGKKFLNLFCYTATATVQAILGGAASTISVDMSNTYIDWAKRNFELNNIHSKQHKLHRADVFDWLKHCRQGFDMIMLDPPSFSNSKKMTSVLDIQKDHPALIRRCMDILNPGGALYFSNNLRSFKLDPEIESRYDVEDITQATLDPDFERNTKIHRCWVLTQK